MRTVILVLTFAAGLAGCYTEEKRRLPPPGPPVPAPPASARPPAARPPPPAVPAPAQIAPPAFAVAAFRMAKDGREWDGEETALALNLLSNNRLTAEKAAALPGEMPPGILEAAQAAAAAHAQAGGKGDVFIFGEVTPGPQNQVRLAAIDLRTGKQIDNFGNQIAAARGYEEVTRKTLEELLASVIGWWSGPARTAPPPPGAGPPDASAPPTAPR